MKRLVVFVGVLLLPAMVLFAQDIAGEYQVSIQGTNVFMDRNPAVRNITDNTTMEIEQSGETIILTFGSFAGASAATIFKGKVGNGRLSAVWWYNGAPHETKVIWGRVSGDGRTIKGEFFYPRVAPQSDGQIPGWVEAKFTARKKLQVVTGVINPDIQLRVKEDCVQFDPQNVDVRRIEGRWKIVEGSHWIMDFGNNRDEARKAFGVIRKYNMDSRCFVGRPDPSMEYALVNGQAPEGPMRGEDCIGFNPDNIEVKEFNGRWKIVEGSHWIMDFDNKEAEARKAFSIIKMHGFDHICYIGRPNPSMTYFRK